MSCIEIHTLTSTVCNKLDANKNGKLKTVWAFDKEYQMVSSKYRMKHYRKQATPDFQKINDCFIGNHKNGIHYGALRVSDSIAINEFTPDVDFWTLTSDSGKIIKSGKKEIATSLFYTTFIIDVNQLIENAKIANIPLEDVLTMKNIAFHISNWGKMNIEPSYLAIGVADCGCAFDIFDILDKKQEDAIQIIHQELKKRDNYKFVDWTLFNSSAKIVEQIRNLFLIAIKSNQV